MSKSNKSISVNANSLMTNNVNVGIEEVVNVFVSKYETDLVNQLQQCMDELSTNNKNIKNLDKQIVKSVKHEEKQNVDFGKLKLKLKHEDTIIHWDRNVVDVQFKVFSTCESYATIFSNIEIEIEKDDIKEHEKLVELSSNLGSEISRVKKLLNDVSRKERQIKGEISSRKLQESGFSDLLNDSELLKLCKF